MITAAQKHAQRNRGTLFVESGEVLAVERFPGQQVIMRIRAPKCAAAAKPGSFVHVCCDDALPMRRPLSIMRAQDDSIEVLFKTLGDGLRLLAAKHLGDTVSLLGPIGKPFNATPDRPHCLLIGGGVGIPPMVFLADRLRHDRAFNPVAILGSEIPFPFELQPSQLAAAWAGSSVTNCMPLLEHWGIPSRLCSLADFPGTHRGYVTDLAELYLQSLSDKERSATKIFTCGPTVMLKAVADLAARYDLPCEVSLEEFMACAVGGCAGCTVEISTPEGPAMQRVCVDGPVFDASVVNW
jgi:dihydroorotate dehydrogenase electron transfer subunit